MNLFLKNVELDDIKDSVERYFGNENIDRVFKDSDYLENRNGLIKNLRVFKSDMFVLAVYNVNCLRWSLVYFFVAFMAGRHESYVIDTTGHFKKITLLFLSKHILIGLFSLFSQIWSLFAYRNKLKKVVEDSESQKKTLGEHIAYIRATDTFNLQIGGSLGHTIGIINAAEENGRKVTFFGIDDINQLKCSAKVIFPPIQSSYVFPLFERFAYGEQFSKNIMNHFSETAYRFIYQRSSRDNITGVTLSKMFNIPLVLEFNSFLSWDLAGANHPIHKLFIKPTMEIEEFTLRHADLIVVVSKVLERQLIDFGIPGDKILMKPNAVDTERFYDKGAQNNLRKSLQLEGDCVVGFSGTIGFWHGIDVLAEAILLVSENNQKIDFVIIGDGAYRKSCEEKLQHLSNVKFTGGIPYDEMTAYLSLCDVLLSPHKTKPGESFIGSPTKLFEYMSCEKIVIASALDQISEIVSPSLDIGQLRDGKFGDDAVGICVEPGDSEELAEAITLTYQNLDACKVLGKRAREKVLNNYTWSHVVGDIEAKLDAIISPLRH